MTTEEREEYFKSDKSDWFTEVDGKKKWDNHKVSQFWSRLRQSYTRTFNDYVFPKFEERDINIGDNQILKHSENFWSQGSKREFLFDTSFHTAIFLDVADFSGVIFYAEASLIRAQFKDTVLFKRAQFNGDMWFGFCQFKYHAYFQAVSFKRYTDFYDFTFAGDVTFENAQFLGKIDFHKLNFKGNTKFKNVSFGDSGRVLFKDILSAPKLNFEDVTFTKRVIITRVNLSKTTFIHSDLSDVQFRECEWGKSKRIELFDEKEKNFKGLERTYRQLKKNYTSEKDWELSGMAYRSEMLMRRYQLYQSFSSKLFRPFFIFNSDFWEWFIYWIYGRCSGFTQSFLTPLILLLTSVFGFGCYFYLNQIFSIPRKQNETIFDSMEAVNFFDCLEYSLANSLPLFKTELTLSNWWIQSLETFICSVLLIFFVLALRKRFKQ